MKSRFPTGEAVVYVIDDDLAVREALSSLIRSAGLQVETFSSAGKFLLRARRDVPSCLVLDVRLPGLSGLELQRELRAAGDDLPIIFITGHGDIPMSVQAMKAGAVEFLPKPFGDGDLLRAVEHALEQHRQGLRDRMETSELRARYDTLTPRERDVMSLVVQGLLNKQIAGQLGTAEITVKIQRAQVMKKMKSGSVPDLVRMAQRLESAAGSAFAPLPVLSLLPAGK